MLSKRSEWKQFNASAPWNQLYDFKESKDDGFIVFMAENNSTKNITMKIGIKGSNNIRCSKYFNV